VTGRADGASPLWSNSGMSGSGGSIQSPCVRHCCLDDDDVCLGCFRSLEEIKTWTLVDDRGRTEILQRAARRREIAGVN